ncbi:polysaccharide pyruvyl transferase family protein [Aeromicrobium alkaliterrae]
MRHTLGIIKRRLRRVVTVAEAWAMPLLIRALARGVRRHRSPASTTTVVVTPHVSGNNGDVALIEAFVENAPRPLLVVTREVTELPPSSDPDVEVIAVPHLIYGNTLARWRALRVFVRRLRGARSVSLIGADVMDGHYNLSAAVRRAELVRLGAASGIPSRVLGFSWNGTPEPLAARALTSAARAGARLMAREPVSLDRLTALHLDVELVTDLVLAASATDADAAQDLLDGLGITGPYAIVNASGLVGRLTTQAEAYVEAIATLRAHGLEVVLLPHVIRKSGDDLAQLTGIKQRISEDIVLVTEVPPPAVVRSLCGGADLVVSGRMHVGVMSLWAGTPAIILSTQGKVEGLTRVFGVPDLMVSLDHDLRVELPRKVSEALASRDDLARRIADHQTTARQLAHRNFDGL